MAVYTLHDIIKKVLGPIKPVGDSGIDKIRYGNLLNTMEVVESLLQEINNVSQCKNNHQDSMSKAGKKANDFLRDVYLEYERE